MRKTLEHLGCRLSYRIVGRGPPVLLIQGVGVQGAGWTPQTDRLSERYTCLTFDNRGMARSQPVGAEVTVDQMADDALAILDHEGWGTVHLAGHSLGGVVALQLALRSPGRVRSLALLCTFASGRAAAPLSLRMLALGAGARVGTRRMRRHAFLRLVLPPGDSADPDGVAERLAELFGHDLADQPPIVAAQLRALRSADLSDRLAPLQAIRTLVVSAAHDPIAPPTAGRALALGIPGSRYVEIDGASHGLPITHADQLNGLLAEHFAAADGNGGGQDSSVARQVVEPPSAR